MFDWMRSILLWLRDLWRWRKGFPHVDKVVNNPPPPVRSINRVKDRSDRGVMIWPSKILGTATRAAYNQRRNEVYRSLNKGAN